MEVLAVLAVCGGPVVLIGIGAAAQAYGGRGVAAGAAGVVLLLTIKLLQVL